MILSLFLLINVHLILTSEVPVPDEDHESLEAWISSLKTLEHGLEESNAALIKEPGNDLADEQTSQAPLKFKAVWNSAGAANYLTNNVSNNSQGNILPTIIPPLSAFTISMWVKDISSNIITWLMSYVTSESRAMYLYYDKRSETYYFSLINSGATCKITARPVRGSWRHILISWTSDGGSFGMYSDGKRLSCTKTVLANGAVIPRGFGKRMVFGGLEELSGINPSYPFQGEITYINVYDYLTTGHGVAEMEEKRIGDGNILAWSPSNLTFHGDITLVTGNELGIKSLEQDTGTLEEAIEDSSQMM